MSFDQIIKDKKEDKLSYQDVQFFFAEISKTDFNEKECVTFLKLFKNFNIDEMYYFTKAFCETGKIFNFKTNAPLVDKTSVGGINDVVSLVTIPILASLGFMVTKMVASEDEFDINSSDRLNLINGFTSELSDRKITKILNETDMCFFDKPKDVLPLEKIFVSLLKTSKMYDDKKFKAILLVAKKVVLKIKYLLLDVRTGEGAEFASMAEGEDFANLVDELAGRFNILTSVNIFYSKEPIQKEIGLKLELNLAINILSNRIKYKSSPFFKICEQIISRLLIDSEQATSKKETTHMINNAINSGFALEKFMKLVLAQGGDLRFFDNPDELIDFPSEISIKSTTLGFVKDVNVNIIKRVIYLLGGQKDENGRLVDSNVGIVVKVNEGSRVKKNQILADVYFSPNNPKFAQSIKLLNSAFLIVKNKKQL